MKEYSRIVIEQYCMTHPKTKKSKLLWELVELSYELECEPEEEEMIELSKIISREREPALKEALIDLDEFLCG